MIISRSYVTGSLATYVGRFSAVKLIGSVYLQAPVALRQKVVFRESDLIQLGEHDFDNMFKGLLERRWGRYDANESSSGEISLKVSQYPMKHKFFVKSSLMSF